MSVTIDLGGKVVLVTGAAGGLGSATVRRLTAAGARVALTDLRAEDLAPLEEEFGDVVRAWPADLRDGDAARGLVAAVAEEFGRIDGLVACAGVMQTKPLAQLTDDEWRKVVDVNLTGTFLVVQATADVMHATGGGAMVIFSSVAGRSGRPLAAHYAASKAALLSLTQSAALALAPGIRVNAVCPGIILTQMWDGIMADRDTFLGDGAGAEYRREIESAAPLGRSGHPREVADAVLFLLSDLSSYMTGQALNVDGGLEMD